VVVALISLHVGEDVSGIFNSQAKHIHISINMKIILKPLKDQVIVITGATSGIGLLTAKMAARNGARIVAVARNEEALQKLTDEINQLGGTAMYVHADIGKEEDVHRIAVAAIRTYGTFDTWVNNAGVSIAGGCVDISIEDMKRMIDTNFWGVVYGSRVAAQHFKQRNVAGAIVTIGSFSGDRANVSQSSYITSKHAAQVWTEALRMEMEKERAPVSVSLIHTARTTGSANENGAEHFEESSSHRNMVAREAVAEAILYCAQSPKREMFINFQSKLFAVLDAISPRLMDKVMEMSYPRKTPPVLNGSIAANGMHPQKEAISNAKKGLKNYYDKASKHPVLSMLVVAGLGTGIWMLTKRKKLLGF
jgi:short-subunit dehydrogenase